MKNKTVSAKNNSIASRSVRALRYCAVPFAAFFAAQTASAATIVWSGATNAIWATGTNWVGGTAPGTGDTAVFNGTSSNVTPDLGAGVTVNTISFETSSAAAYIIGSGGAGVQSLTLNNGGGITMGVGVNAAETVNANIVLGTDGSQQTFAITSNNTFATSKQLTIAGGISGSSGAGVKTLNVVSNGVQGNTGQTISITGSITDGAGGGTVKLVKDGDGTLQIGGSSVTNTYSGGTYLNAGTLTIVGAGSSLKANSSLFIAGGTTLNSVNALGTFSGIVQQWNGDFAFGDSTRQASALNSMTFNTGTVDLGATGTDTVRTVNALSNTLTVNSIISNGTNTTTTGLTKTGAGTLVLGGINTYTGTTTVNAGTLTITATPTGGGAYAALGSGILNVSTTTGSLINSSAITIAGGNLTLTNTTTAEGSVNRLSNSTAITSNGGTLTYNNTTGNTYAENVGNVTLNGGQLNTVLSTNMATGIQTLTFNGLTQNNRSTATFSAATTTPNATTNIIKVSGATATAGGQIIGPWATTGTSAIVQTDYAVYDAAGNIVAANIAGSLDSTWTDSTKAYTSDFLGGGAGNALSAVTHNMAALRNLPAFGNANTATTIVIPTGGNLNTFGLLNANQGLWTINQVAGSTGALSTPSGGGSIYINTGNGTGSGNGAITIGAPINDNSGAVSIVKTGTGNSVAVGQGVLTLSNVTSNFTGATVINGGAIVLNTSGALADINVASSLGKGSSGGSAADLVINGGFLQYGTATTAVSTNRLFSIGAMGGTIDSTGATTATMSFVGTGAMGFASQTGPRTLTLQGSNVGVAASTSGSNSSLSTIALLIGDNSGATSLTKTGTGTWALTNSASTYTGPTTITGGILNVGTFAAANTASSLGKGSATTLATDLILNGGTLQYSNKAAATTNRLFSVGTSNGTIDSSAASPSNTLSFTATGAMGFNNTTGARTLTLAGTNFGANSMGLRLDDFGGLTNLTKSANGTWVLANAGNTYTGVTTINNGILSVGKLANGGVASSIGASTNLPANLLMTAENATFTAGNLGSLLSLVQPATSISLATVAPTLKYTGTGDSTDRTIKFMINSNDRAAVIDASGTGALNFTNANFTTNATTSFNTAARRLALVLTGGNSADYTLANTISGIITDNTSEPTSIVKTGLGTWVLAGNNSYGTISANGFGTMVNQGTLVLSGSPTGTVKTTVNAGGTLKLDYSTNNTSKLADTVGILQLAGGTLNLSGGSHAEAVTSTTFSPGASSIIQSGGRTVAIHLNALTRQAGGMVDFGSGTVADTDTINAAGVGILGAYATIAGANWAKSVDSSAADTAITAYTTGYTDIDALGSTIASSANTNVRLNTAAGSGDITLGAATTTINTLLQNTTTAATIDTTAKTLQTTGIMIGDGKESLTIGLPAGTGSLQAAASAGDLVLNNASNYSGGNSGKTLTVNVPVILNGASTLTTAGNVTLNGVNTYTGATFVNAGTLTISGTGSLQSGAYGGAITIAQGATLNYTSSANQTLSGGTSGFGNFIWNPSSSSAILTAGARGATPAVLTIKSGIVFGIVGNLGTGPASDLILDGGIIRTKDGGGGADQSSRLFTLGAGGGTIQIDDLTVPGTTTRPTEFTGTGAIAFTGSGARTLKFESAIMNVSKFSPALGDGSGGVTSVIMGGTAGAYGVWAFDGANTYTGTTTVNGGHLSIRKTQSVNGGVAYFTPANITVTPGAGVAGIAIGVGAGPTYFDSTAIAAILDNSHLGASTTSTGLKPGAQFGLDTTAGDFTYAGTLADFTAGDSNVFNLAKHGTGTLTLTGNNTYTGTTTIYGSGIGHGTGTSILRAGSATAFGPATTASIVFDQGAFSLINKLQLFGNNVTVIGLNSPVMNHRDGSGQNIIESGSSDTSGTGTDILTINNTTTSTWNNASGANGPVSRIQDGSTRKLGITKGGAGTLELGGTNTYTGGTIINAGVLRLLNTQALGGASGAAGTVTFGASSTGTLRLNANSITIVGLDTNATVGTPVVENGTAGNATLTVSNTANSTFAGVLQNGAAGTLMFTKSGAGTLTLSGDNTYGGATSVSAGKLILSGDNSGSASAIGITGGVVQFNALNSINSSGRSVTVTTPGAMVFGATLSDVNIAAGLLRVVTGSTGAIAADNNAAGAFDFSTAGLTNASLGAVGSVNYTGTLTPNGGTYRLGGGGGTLTYPTIITGSALTVTGASTGSVVLSNVDNTLATLTISSGVLDLNATTTQTAGSVVLSGGTLQNGTLTGTAYSGTGGTSTAVLAGSGIVFTNTSGTTTLNATNTYDGGTNITGGTLKAVAAGSLGSGLVTISNGATLALASDGTGTGLGNSKLESINYGNDIALSGAAQTITVGQFTANVGTLNAANKTLQLDTLSIGAQALTVNNSNVFGLEFTGATTLTGATASTFSVGTANVSTAVFGLTLNGLVSDGATSSANDAVILTKSGAGTLVLKGSNTTFGGNGGATGQIIDITNGYLAAATDAALGVTGATGNMVRINTNDVAKGFLATGTFSTDRTFRLNAGNNALDVTQGNTLTLTTPFSLQAVSHALRKNDNGVLEINANNSTWTGIATVAAGVLKVSNAGALGTTAGNTVVSNAVGSAVQINGVNISELFNLTGSGINSGGALENLSGTNALSGAITLGGAATIGSTADTLTLSGGISGANALTFSGAGGIAVTTTAIGAVSSITKIGSGTTTLSVLSNSFVGGLTVNAGTFKIDGTTAKIGGTGAISVTNGATLTLDNTAGNVDNRLTARAITLAGATLNFTGNGATVETLGALTAINAGLTTINTNTSGTLKFASLTARNAGGVVNVVSGGTSSVQFTTAPALTPASTGILPGWFAGNEFATHGGNNTAIAAFTAYTIGDLGTVAATTGTFKPSGAQTSVNTKTINALNLTGSIGATMNAGQTLTLTAGGLINSGSGNISGGFLSPTVELIANYSADSAISSIITGSQAFTKTGSGNLTLSALDNYTGTTTINQGTLTLGGGNNTLATNRVMVLNNGGTLALGSNSQYLGSLTSTGLVEGSGGNITGTGTLTTNGTNGTFAGNLGSDGGALNFIKAGANTMTLSSAQSTTGTISVIGGGITLKDGGTLLGVNITGGITLNGGTLTIDNTGTKNIADRVKDTAPITMNTGTITYNGRAQFNSTETLGDVTLNTGANMFAAAVGGTGVNSAQLNLTSLTRNAGATMFLNGGTNLGQIGNSSRIVVTGTQTGLTPINGVVPGVFKMSSTDSYLFVGYAPGLGFGELGTAGFPATTATFTGAGATDNVLSPGTANVVANQTINALSRANLTFSNGTATGGTDLLTIGSGMTITGRNDWGTTTQRGRITSGTNEFFIFKTDGNVTPDPTVNTVITDKNGGVAVNPTDKVSLVVLATHQDRGPYVILTAPNTYSGGTFVNAGPTAAQGGIELNATAAGTVVIPAGGLTINNNAVVDMVTFAGQIDSSNVVTINGGGMLRLAGNNTLAGLVFNSNGGTNVPTVIPYNSNTLGGGNSFATFGAKTGILTISGNITSNPSNVAVTPLLDSGFLDLNNTSHNITVDGGATTASLFHAGNGAAVTGLTISSIINSTTPASGSITKLGTGVLELSGVNVFTGGLNVNAGAVKVSNAAALGGTGNTVTLNNNAALWLNAVPAGQTIVVSATGGTIASLADQSINDNITLNGVLTISLADPTLNNTDRTINYNSAAGGTAGISGTGSLVVSGNANNNFNASPKALFMQQNTVTNTYTGGTTINSGGRIKMGVATKVVGDNFAAFGNLGSSSGTLTVNTGGTLDLNAFSQTVGNFTGTGGTVASFNGGTPTFTIGNGNTGGGTFAGVIANGTGTVALSKVGSGTITLSGSNTHTGGTTVAGGTLALDFTTATTAAPVLASTGVLTLAGGTLDLRNGTAQVQVVASTTLTGGLSNVTQSSGSSILRMNAITPGVGVVNFGEESIASTTNTNDASGILGAWATIGGTDWAVKSASVENGSNNYITAYGAYTDIDAQAGGANPNIVDGSTTNVRIQNDGTSGAIGLSAGTTTVNTVLQNNASFATTVDTATKALVTNGIMIGSGKEALTIGAAVGDGSLKTATVGNLALINNNASKTLTVNAPIIVNSTSGLSTAGNVLLNGANTFTGPIGIGNGTLEIGGAGRLNGGSYGGTIQVASGSTFKYNSSANQTLTAAISGAGALVKDGVGSLTVQGTNVFTGGTTVNGGKLILQSGNDTSANLGSLVINSGGTVEVLGVNPLWNGTSPDRIITINGGTLTRTSGGNGNQDYRVKSIEMTAGLISSTSVGYMEFFNDAYGLSVPVNTYASSSEAVISANWGARNNGGTTTFVFTTADGTTASGVDLLFSGNLAANTVYNVTKAGAGVMAISANYHTTTVYGTGTFAGYSGTTTINGGTLQLGNGGAAGTLNPLSAIVNNGTLAFNRDATSNLVQGTHFNSVISGTGGVSQLGVGTTILSGVNTYTGATLVSNGTLLVSGSISGSAVTVSGTGTLGSSSGTTGGLVGSVTVTSGGTLAPGASTGILTSSGNLTMSSGSTFAAEVNATGVGTGYDQMIVAGNVNLGGSTLSLSGSTYNLGDTGDVFTLILNNGASAVTGTFSGLSNGSSVFFGGQEFQISYFDIASTGGFELSGGNDVSLMAVPEPGAAVSLLGGLGLLLGLRRRRRA